MSCPDDYHVIRDCELVEVIRVEYLTGVGNVGSPARLVTEYYAKTGELLARNDNWVNGQKKDGAQLYTGIA